MNTDNSVVKAWCRGGEDRFRVEGGGGQWGKKGYNTDNFFKKYSKSEQIVTKGYILVATHYKAKIMCNYHQFFKTVPTWVKCVCVYLCKIILIMDIQTRN